MRKYLGQYYLNILNIQCDVLTVFVSCSWFFLVPPSIIGLNPENVTVVVNNFVSVSCEATGFPPPMLSWLNDRGPIQGNHNALIMPGSLLLMGPYEENKDINENIIFPILL